MLSVKLYEWREKTPYPNLTTMVNKSRNL